MTKLTHSERDIKVTMDFYRCSRADAIESLDEGNFEAVNDADDREAYDNERDMAAMDDWG